MVLQKNKQLLVSDSNGHLINTNVNPKVQLYMIMHVTLQKVITPKSANIMTSHQSANLYIASKNNNRDRTLFDNNRPSYQFRTACST